MAKKKAGKQSQWAEVWRRLKMNKTAMLGLGIILILIVTAIFAPWIAPYPPNQPNVIDRLQGPSWQHLLGTDNFGRDIFSRIIYGTRISL
ncbi:MAG: ABC transporter permease, partial [Bacillota bacterium]